MTEDDHPIHSLSVKDAEVFHKTDELALAQVDEDGDLPILGVALDSGAHCIFYPHEGGEILRVLDITNMEENSGELTQMMNFITQRFGVTEIEFFNVTNDDLINTLNRPSTKTIQVDDPRYDEPQKVLVARVNWER